MVTLRGQALTIPYRLIGADRMPAAPSSRGAGVNRSYRPTENADLRWMDSTFIANERVTALLQPVARRCSIRRRSTLLAAIQTLIMAFRHPRCKRSSGEKACSLLRPASQTTALHLHVSSSMDLPNSAAVPLRVGDPRPPSRGGNGRSAMSAPAAGQRGQRSRQRHFG